MRPIKVGLNLGQTGEEVANLQEVLMAFITGKILIPSVPEHVNDLANENIKRFFGSATNSLLKDFCEQYDLTLPPENSPQVNEVIAAKLNDELAEMLSHASVTIQGNVQHISDKQLAAQYVVDIYTRGYRDHENLLVSVDVAGNGDFAYTFPVAVDQLTDSKGYHAKVKALGGSAEVGSASAFGRTDIRFDIVIEDETQSADSEFDTIVDALNRVIGSGHQIKDINLNPGPTEPNDLEFLSSAIGETKQLITKIVQAHQLSDTLGGINKPSLLYGLLRQNIAPNLMVLINQSAANVIQMLNIAIANKTISSTGEDKELFATGLASSAAAAFAGNDASEDVRESAVFRMASYALEDAEKAKKFIQLSASYTAEENFWEYIAAAFSDPEDESGTEPAEVTALKKVANLSMLTVNNPALTNELFAASDGQDLKTWAPALTVAELKQAIQDNEASGEFTYPDFISPEDVNKPQLYAEYIFKTIRETYPTQALTHSIDGSEWNALSTLKEGYADFVTANENFDLKTVPAFTLPGNEAFTLPDVEDTAVFIEELGIAQRLLAVTGNHELVAALAAGGLHSSLQISRISEDDFVTTYQDMAGSEATAKDIYSAALSNSTYSFFVALEQFMDLNSPTIYTLDKEAAGSSAMTFSTTDAFAEWRSLFGSLDGCNCSHCQSVYSPAAYLTDLLEFLKKNTPALYSDLVARRPDIVHIELTCKNINTPVPHIDIVNELLEDLVSAEGGYTMYARQTTLDAATQRAIPEYINTSGETIPKWDSVNKKYGPATITIPSPYRKLADAVYPVSLPYNYFKRQISTHLDLAGVKGHELLQRFSAKDLLEILEYSSSMGSLNSSFCTEYIGISSREMYIITGNAILTATGQEDPANPFAYYGFVQSQTNSNNLQPVKDPANRGSRYPGPTSFPKANWLSVISDRVDVFLQQVGITYTELQEILDCYVINIVVNTDKDREMAIIANSSATSDDTCNPAHLRISGFNEAAARKIYRFIRMKRALGWTYYELDKALMSVDTANSNENDILTTGYIDITHENFIKLVQIKWLSDTLKLPVSEVALFWKQIDTRLYRDFDRSEAQYILPEYEHIFRNPLTKDINDVAYPFKTNPSSNTIPDDVLNYLSGVLHLDIPGLTLLFDQLFPSAYNNQLADLSKLRREVMLMKVLKLKPEEWLQYRKWITDSDFFGNGTDVYSKAFNLSNDLFNSPYEVIRFITFVNANRNAGIKMADVNYLLHDVMQDSIAAEKQEAKLAKTLVALRTALQKASLPEYSELGDDNGKKLEVLLQRIMDADDAGALINILQNPIADPGKDHTAEEKAFMRSELFNELIPEDIITNIVDFHVGTGLNAGYLDNPVDRRIAVYGSLLSYTEAKVIPAFATSFLAKEFKLEEEVTNVLLDSCIKVDVDITAMQAFILREFVLSDVAPTRTNTKTAKPFIAIIRLQKAAWLINKFKLSLADVNGLWHRTKKAVEGIFDLSGLAVSATTNPDIKFSKWLYFLKWIEIATFLGTNTEKLYTVVKDIPSAGSFLPDLAADLATIFKMDVYDMEALSGTDSVSGALGYSTPADYKSPYVYLRIIDCLEMQSLLPAPMPVLVKAGNVITGTGSQAQANVIIQLVKSQYDNAQWQEVIRPVNDQLRTERRDAMVTYLLANPPGLYKDRWFTSNDIYETMMLDVDMMSCMATTRVLLAVNTVQLWVDRVLLGLERDVNNNLLKLTPANARQWRMWRKLYRVWEANRKVFIYPENWIEPELRDGKSPFFLELEKFLKQNDLTDANVEEAYRTYLERLDEVSDLEIVGMYRETKQTDYKNFFYNSNALNRDIIHVFGRTPENPHIYYYRKRVADEWTPWEKMDVQIDGDHFVPVMWRGRLRFYWLVFTKDQVDSSASTIASAEKYVMPPTTRWKIQLAWTELKNGKWTAKQLSKDAAYGEDYTEEDPVSLEHISYAATTWGSKRRWAFVGALENQKKSGFRFYSKIENGQLTFVIAEGVISPDAHDIKGLVNENLKTLTDNTGGVQNGEEMDFWNKLRRLKLYFFNKKDVSWYKRSYFTVKFNGVIVSPLTTGERNLYQDDISGSNKIALPEQNYRTEYTRYKYDFSAGNGYSHYPDDNIKLLGYTPDIQSGEKKDKYLLIPRQTPDGYSQSQPIKMPYFVYSDYNNTFFVEKVVYPFGLFSGNGGFGNHVIAVDGYRFRNFRHSNVNDFQETLFNNGLEGLLNRDYISGLNYNINFPAYQPTASVVKTLNYSDELYPNGKVDFESDGAYSLYNWELFFHIPMLMANKLSQDQKFEEARKWYHYVFDPTAGNATTPKDFWNLGAFYKAADHIPAIDEIMQSSSLENDVARWANDPFKPHLVARTRISAYMKNVVMKYMDNLVAWADMLYRTDTRENINEATLLYVLVAQLLGRKPLKMPARATAGTRTYTSLIANSADMNAFSNGHVKIESLLLASGAKHLIDPNTLQKVSNAISGSMYFFCFPMNDKLAGYWDIIADRLFKIRHCQNIDGIERELALFDPPIDPALLVKAAAAGLSLAEAMADINATLPSYRFNVMSQKATELTQEVKSLGAQLLSALEKKDAEYIALLRSSQELTVMDLVTEVREQQVQDAVAQVNGMQQQQKMTTQRRDYYKKLVDGGLNAGETLHLGSVANAIGLTITQGATAVLAAFTKLIPDVMVGPLSMGAQYGGRNIGGSGKSSADVLGIASNLNSHIGQMASIKAGYTRRKEDWEQQLKTAEVELKQVEYQIIGAQIRQAVAEMELRNHKVQVENAKAMDTAMREKYTNEELYEWMISEISITYFQAYKMAIEVAKKAQRCYRHELGIDDATFIQPTYWDSLKKGLLAGEQLMFDIKRMEVSYLDKNKRHLELTKHVSLATIFPDALLDLKNGKKVDDIIERVCNISIPEWLYDMDYPGHHLRRIKSVSISIPCVAGPYTTVACKLSLTSSKYRKNGLLNGKDYTDEEQYKQLYGSIQSIATSHAQSDTGMFDFSFRDERYLPFEGMGAISNWRIELPATYAQFDPASISDVILHINYTALDEGGLKTDAIGNVISEVQVDFDPDMNKEGGFFRVFHLNSEFATQWKAYGNAFKLNDKAAITLKLNEQQFPFFSSGRGIIMDEFSVLVKAKDPDKEYTLKMVTTEFEEGADLDYSEDSDVYSGTISEEEISIFKNTRIVKLTMVDGDENKVNMTEELEDLVIIAHYKLDLEREGEADDNDEDWNELGEMLLLETPLMTATPGNNIVNVSWSAIPHATGYRIEKSTTPSSAGSSEITVSDVSAILTGTNGQPLYFRIKALGDDDYADSHYSAWMNETPEASGGSLAPTSNMAAWWKADNLVNHTGGVVDSWGDSSGNGNTMAVPSGSVIYNPLLVVSNGVPAVSFNEDLLMTNDVISDTESFTIFYAGSSGIGRGLDNSGPGWSIGVQPKALYPSSVVLTAGGGIGYTLNESSAINDSDIIAFRCSQNFASSTTTIALFSRDGVKVEERTVNNHTLRSSGYGMLLGYIGSLNSPVDGVTYESIVYNRVLTDQEISDTMAYLCDRYDFLT